MGFTLRFILGIALVLTTSSLTESASRWRHIRQIPPVEDLSDSSTTEQPSNPNKNQSFQNERNNKNNTVENVSKSEENVNNSNYKRLEKPIQIAEKKPKTETSTDKNEIFNSINVNKTELDRKLINNFSSKEIKNVEQILEKPLEESRETEVPTITLKVPELQQTTPSFRDEGGRALDLDISKYVSPEFHNKNNVYSFSSSTDSEKFIKYNDLLKSTTKTNNQYTDSVFDGDQTTSLSKFLDKKHKSIQEDVEMNLKYIDKKFAENEENFHKNADISETFQVPKDNDTNVNYISTKYVNLTKDFKEDAKKVHKETDLETGQSINYHSSYNKTEVFDDTPKDYKNKIPTSEDEILSETYGNSKPKSITKSSTGSTEANVLYGASTNSNKPNQSEPEASENVNLKESTSLTKPPSLNKTESHKSLLSNKIETEPVDTSNSAKLKWNLSYGLTTFKPVAAKVNATKNIQKEETIYVPYKKEDAINVSKRGQTKYVDTLKIPSSTEKLTLRPNSTFNVTSDINKTNEPDVLENQVHPVQLPPPDRTINETEIIRTIEETQTNDSISYFEPSTTLSSLPTEAITNPITDEVEVTTSEEIVENGTEFITTPSTETTTVNLVTEVPTVTIATETTTINENLTTRTDMEITTATSAPEITTPSETTTATLLTTIPDFIITTYKIDTSNSTEEEKDLSQVSLESETTTSGELTSDDSYLSDSQSQEYPDVSSTASSYEDNETTAYNSYENLDMDQRSSSGRDLKTTTHQANFSLNYQTVAINLNMSDFNITTTTEMSTNATTFTNEITTTEQQIVLNKTQDEGSTSTSDYRENTIGKQTYSITSTTTTQQPDENSHELVGRRNLTDTERDYEAVDDETDDDVESEIIDQDRSTPSTPVTKPNLHPRTTDTTPFIIPLNTSMIDLDITETTTMGNNLGLLNPDMDNNGGPIAAISISCVGAICLVLLVGLLIVMRKRHKKFNYGQRCTPVSLDAYSVDNVSVYNSMRRKGAMRASKRSYGNPAFEDPTSVTNPLNFAALAKFVNNSEAISSEFEEIPQVTAQMNELPEGCEIKNRYANVIPLPETRVFLNPIDGYPNSDYINANYVTGPKNIKNYYIACQAPLENTVDDFWKMVWEQQSKVILMITHLFENGGEKCIDYLPPSEVLDCHRMFGDFQVTLKKREVKEKYVISSLQLKNMVSNSWREVTHLWYLGWPEKGVPSEANSIIAFLIEARSYIKSLSSNDSNKTLEHPDDHISNGIPNNDKSPVIVHCSPGTGRTGVVIASDIAIREFELTRQVDIPTTVYRIRRDRASAVQTKEQYGFIYKVIALYATKLTGGVLDSL